jgi:hypothetical protein
MIAAYKIIRYLGGVHKITTFTKHEQVYFYGLSGSPPGSGGKVGGVTITTLFGFFGFAASFEQETTIVPNTATNMIFRANFFIVKFLCNIKQKSK